MFTVAVIGGSGLVGRAVMETLAEQADWRVIGTAHRRAGGALMPLDIRDAAAIDAFMARTSPDAVVIAAAERRPDVCESDPALARALNVDAVRAIASAGRRHDAWVLSISTDYVFDGTRPPYGVDDPPCPLNAYGRSKLDGERALAQATDFGCVLRLPLLFGHITDLTESAVTSLVPAVLASARAGAPAARMDAWATRYPTFTGDVAYVIRDLLQRAASGTAVCGRAHWSGDEPMTKFDIAVRIARILRLDARLEPVASSVDSTPRPRDCHLDASRLEALGIGCRTPFDDALGCVLERYLAQHPGARA
jgi:dTDP-4-dehydrorhamnose reductase